VTPPLSLGYSILLFIYLKTHTSTSDASYLFVDAT
jgi:hypothetical protein